MRVFVLDDMDTRLVYFQKWYEDKHDYTEAKDARHAIKTMRDAPKFDVYFLDHDLNPDHYDDSGSNMGGYGAPPPEKSWGTGMDVCQFIVSELPVEKRPKLVVCHSWNSSAADEMAHKLADAGIRVAIYMYKPGPSFLNLEEHVEKK